MRLAQTYDEAVAWLRETADGEEVVDHTDAFLVDEVFVRLADDLAADAQALREAAADGAELSVTRVRQLYRRLAWIFRAEVTSLRAQAFASLSHESNKAMNLNSYIGLMGGRYRIGDTAGGRVLLPVQRRRMPTSTSPTPSTCSRSTPTACCCRSTACGWSLHASSPRTPASLSRRRRTRAYPGAPTRLERIAGATTDIQHIVHQGMTRYGATFWVGANAVLRKTRARRHHAEATHEGGFTDPAVHPGPHLIEDTESTHRPARQGLARSTTTPSGSATAPRRPTSASLCVQRERWANGGLHHHAEGLPDDARPQADRRDASSRGSSGCPTSWASCGRVSAW